MWLWKLIPKLYFSFGEGDPTPGGDPTLTEPEPEPSPTEPEPTSEPTETESKEYEVKVDGEVLKVPLEELLAGYSRETDYRRKTQALSEKEKEWARTLEAYESLRADPRLQQPERQPQNEREALKQEYVSQMQKQFPDIDPRFLESQFEWNERLAGFRAQEAVSPLLMRQGEQFEREYLKAHPDVVKGSPEYKKIGALIGARVDPEEAYEMVMWGSKETRKSLMDKEFQDRLKAKEADDKRKLQQSRTASQSGSRPASKDPRERAAAIIDRLYSGD